MAEISIELKKEQAPQVFKNNNGSIEKNKGEFYCATVLRLKTKGLGELKNGWD